MKLHLAILFCLCCLTAAAGAAPGPFGVFDNGLQSARLTTIDAQLNLVQQIGFDGLTWRTDSPARIQQVLAGAKRRGLKVFAIYCNLELKDGALAYDPRLQEIIPLCRGTGTVLWPNMTSQQFKNSDPAGDDIAVAGLRQLADQCERHGVRIALYPHVNMWLHRLEDALRVVKKVNRDNVGVTFNLCHALMDGAEDRIPALLEAAAPRLFLVSINGADSHPATRGWAQLIQPLNQGTYDVGIVLRKLQAIGFHGPVTLQCYNIQGDPKTLLTGSMDAWRRLTGGR